MERRVRAFVSHGAEPDCPDSQFGEEASFLLHEFKWESHKPFCNITNNDLGGVPSRGIASVGHLEW